jgi:hypothetical protein
MGNLVLKMKRGDSKPIFRAQLLDNTTPVDITTAGQIRLFMIKPDEDFFDETMGVDDAVNGWVIRPWGLADIDQVGDYRFEIQVTWGDGKIQTFPADDYGLISVIEDLD